MKDGVSMNYLYESDRLGFIPISEEYKNDYIDMYLNESIQQRVFKKIYNKDQIEKWTEKLISKNNHSYVILSKENNSFIGNIEVILKDNIIEIMLSIIPSMQNRHYGTEAIKETMNYCKNKFNISEFELFVYKNNLNAIHCYEKLGFVNEGNEISENDIHMKLK